MFNQETKRKKAIKNENASNQIQVLRNLGIIWLCLGGANFRFFLLGLMFITSSVVKSKQKEDKNSSIQGV